jgi:pSer/pThr/pTyr-binding forkhead associated (FHA) protein
MPQITVELGGEVVGKYILKKRVIAIGRDEKNDVVLDNLLVSRKHARIKREKGNVYILTDLDTPNKTYVNGEEITERELKDGDEITICHYKLKFNLDKRAGQRGSWKPKDEEGTMMFSSLQAKESALKEEVEELMRMKEEKEEQEKPIEELRPAEKPAEEKKISPTPGEERPLKEEKPKKKKDGFAIFLLVVALIILGLIIYFFYFA